MLELCRANPALARSPMAEDCMPRPSASLATPLFVPRPREIARRRSGFGQWKARASNAGQNLGSPTTENWESRDSVLRWMRVLSIVRQQSADVRFLLVAEQK